MIFNPFDSKECIFNKPVPTETKYILTIINLGERSTILQVIALGFKLIALHSVPDS